MRSSLLKILFLSLLGTTTMIHANIPAKPNISKQLIENLSWQEVAARQKTTQVIIIPLGAAAKEHGPHLPLNNDFIIADYLRDRVLAKMKNALALPTINYSYYPAFLEYPGSTSLSFKTTEQMIIDICQSLAHQGFKSFYILNTGFSTSKPLAAAQAELAKQHIVMDYLIPTNFFNSPFIKKIEQQKRGGHADEIETSMMLYIAPDIVHMEKAIKDDSPDRPGPLTRQLNGEGVYSPTGVWGDPTLATKEKGKLIIEAYVEYTLQQIDQFIKNRR